MPCHMNLLPLTIQLAVAIKLLTNIDLVIVLLRSATVRLSKLVAIAEIPA